MANEKDNFHRLKVALDTERFRSREAIDRDNDTILDLRTALEVLQIFERVLHVATCLLTYLSRLKGKDGEHPVNNAAPPASF